MISCSTTCTVLAVVLSLLATAQTFRVFRGDEEPAIEELQIRNFSELLPLAARTGERVTVEMIEGSQTMIAQHGVNILLDCGALIPTTGRPAEGGVTWEIQRFQRDEFGLFFVPRPSFHVIPGGVKRIMTQGPLNSVLNITSSNAIQGGQDADNAVYTCTACTTDGCNSASMTMYLIGNMFRIIEGGTAEPDSFVDRTFNIGTDFCVTPDSNEKILLHCDFAPQLSHERYVIPVPSRTWFRNNTLIYSVELAGQAPPSDFGEEFIAGSVLTKGAVHPPPFIASSSGTIFMDFTASEFLDPSLAPGSSPESIKRDVFNALLGVWSCRLNTPLQSMTATSIVTQC